MSTTSNINPTDEMYEEFTLMKSPTPTYSLEDFHAQLSALLDDEQGSGQKIHEVLSFLKSAASYLVSESHIYSLKMLRDSSITTEEEPLELSSQVWMNWGMTSNGNVLTARISESHRIGSESLLSEILEDIPDRKYFLSEDVMQKIAFNTEVNKIKNRGFGAKVVSLSEHSVTDFTRETLTISTLQEKYETKLNNLKTIQPEEQETHPNQMDLFGRS
jgi:hypothetical protein